MARSEGGDLLSTGILTWGELQLAKGKLVRPEKWQRPTWAEVDLSAIRHNLAVVRERIGSQRLIMAVVKGDAYGHGALPVAREVMRAGADWLGVALVEEAIELREGGIEAPILVLGPVFPSQAQAVVERDISVCLFTEEMAWALNEAASKMATKAKVHVKVDTGMNRLGIPSHKSLEFLSLLRRYPWVEVQGIYSHLATADTRESEFSSLQMERFFQVERTLREHGMETGLRHLANSAATFGLEAARLDMVRVGIALYGCTPGRWCEMKPPLIPALSWKTKVAYVRDVEAGDSISYGCTFVASKKSRIAVIPVGYGDGLPHGLSNKGEVLVRGRRAPIVGRVCMDMTMVDVTHIEGVGPEDEVVIIGAQGSERITAEEVAERLGTISYEVLCGIGKRVPRVHVNSIED
jgi:alanine racemase